MDSPQINLMTKSLDALWLKQRVISDNIANKDTPFYKAKYVDFAETLQAEKERRYKCNHISGTSKYINTDEILLAQVKVKDETSLRADQNNVNMDKELIEMDRTSMQYEYMIRQLNGNFSTLRTVIKGGK